MGNSEANVAVKVYVFDGKLRGNCALKAELFDGELRGKRGSEC
jgi:hypothetical protein